MKKRSNKLYIYIYTQRLEIGEKWGEINRIQRKSNLLIMRE